MQAVTSCGVQLSTGAQSTPALLNLAKLLCQSPLNKLLLAMDVNVSRAGMFRVFIKTSCIEASPCRVLKATGGPDHESMYR